MGFGGLPLLGKDTSIYTWGWRILQLLSRDVNLCCNDIVSFVRGVHCGEVNLPLVLKREPGLDAWMLHVKTHLDDVINVNNSHPFTLQSSTGRAECRGCRCEFRRLVLRWGLLHFAWIWYSHGNRRSNLAPISCLTGLSAEHPRPVQGWRKGTLEGERRTVRSGGFESWNNSGLTEIMYNY